MKNPRLYPSFLIAAAVAVLLLTAARADESETAKIKFSDPTKVGTLKIIVANGDLRIHGTDDNAVTVETDLKPETPALRKDGLRVLTSSSSYSLTEKNNVVVLSHGSDGWGAGNSSDFNITVPRNTCIVLNSNYGGDVAISDVTGNIDIKTLNGEVVLNDLAGGASVETMNGEIKATVRELVDGKALMFSSMNGEVALNLPVTAKANVRLRTHNGSILTDFDEKSLITKTESIRTSKGRSARTRAPRAVVVDDATDAEVKAAVHEAVRAGAEAAHEVAVAVRDAAIAARNSKRDAERAERDAARAERASQDDDAPEPTFAVPPLAPLPPITGGKIVTGTLNGGGTEIRIATMNGDVTLRKIEK